MEIDRRTAMMVGLAAGVATMPNLAEAQAAAPPPAGFAPKPLPFDPAAIAGLSAKMLTSHHDNN